MGVCGGDLLGTLISGGGNIVESDADVVLRPGRSLRLALGLALAAIAPLVSALTESIAGLFLGAGGALLLYSAHRYRIVVTPSAVVIRRLWDTVHLPRSSVRSVDTVSILGGRGVAPALLLDDGSRITLHAAGSSDDVGARIQANRVADAMDLPRAAGFWGAIG